MQHTAAVPEFQPVPNWPQLPTGVTWGQVVQVIVDGQGRVMFFHRAKPGVLMFDTDGVYLGSWSEERDARFSDIHSAWLGSDDAGEYLLLVNRDENELARTTLDGEVVWAVRDPLLFDRPTDAAAAADGSIYVSDGYGNALTHRLSAKGEHLRSWGQPGSAAGQFQLPHGVWMTQRDGHEVVYVCDRENRRIRSSASTASTSATSATCAVRPTSSSGRMACATSLNWRAASRFWIPTTASSHTWAASRPPRRATSSRRTRSGSTPRAHCT